MQMIHDAAEADPGRVCPSDNARVGSNEYVVLGEVIWILVVQLEESVEHVLCCRRLSDFPLLVAVNLLLGEDVCIVDLFGDEGHHGDQFPQDWMQERIYPNMRNIVESFCEGCGNTPSILPIVEETEAL